jgi:hypothetical protein
MQQIRKILSNHLVNLSGWKTGQKIVVFESDDWGSLRMPSVAAYGTLLAAGIPVDKSPYCKYDNLCSAEDVRLLFDVMQKHKDSRGNHPVITANVVVGNPDFEKIKASGFHHYFYETIDATFDRYFPNDNPMDLWKSGMQSKLFLPQFHGREHVNVPFWLDKLRKNDAVFTKAFEVGCSGISIDVYNRYPKSVQASFDYDDISQLDFMKESLTDGLAIFERLFGFQSQSFIPNNYTWTPELDTTLTANGVKIVQGMKYQLLPKPTGETKRRMTRRWNGQVTNGLLQTVRNVQFEPSLLPDSQKPKAVKDTLDQIAAAFLWKKPAVVTSHRINFCGSLQPENRDSNLILFNQLLSEITKRWPDVVFMDTVSLAQNINKIP